MRSMLSSCLCLLLVSLLPGDDAPVARLGDRTFSRADFAEWLVQRVGVLHVQQYVLEQLALDLAVSRGLEPDDEQVARRYDEEHELVVARGYGGKEDVWQAHIEGQGYTLESWRERREAEIRHELSMEALVMADREPDDALVEQRYRDLYGPDGERVAVQALFFSAYRGVDPEAGRPDLGALKAKSRERAAEARDRWLDGVTLEELLPESDPVGQKGLADGRIALYRRNMVGKEVERAVASLDRPGDVSQPVDVFDGCWVLRLEERVPVPLDDVREDLREELRHDPVTSGELSMLQQSILDKEGLEIVLH
jgi:hypothetical protein